MAMPSSKRKSNLWVYGCFLLMVVVVIVALLVLLSPDVHYMNSTPVPLPTYSKETVLEVCNLLLLEASDAFCIEAAGQSGGTTNQNAKTLEATLYRKFPFGTDFKTMMTLLSSLPSLSQEQSRLGLEFAPDSCPPPNSKDENLTCWIIFPGDVGPVAVEFAPNGRLMKISVRGSKGGSS